MEKGSAKNINWVATSIVREKFPVACGTLTQLHWLVIDHFQFKSDLEYFLIIFGSWPMFDTICHRRCFEIEFYSNKNRFVRKRNTIVKRKEKNRPLISMRFNHGSWWHWEWNVNGWWRMTGRGKCQRGWQSLIFIQLQILFGLMNSRLCKRNVVLLRTRISGSNGVDW